MVSPIRLRQAQLSVKEFAESWQAVLERIGDLLYELARPSIGLAYDSADSGPDFRKSVLERQIGVGWRTWYGPAFVERYDRDWLRGLPDHTRDLPYGGVGHALDRPLLDVVTGSKDLYDSVWPYLDEAELTPFWPRRRAAAGSRRIPKQKPATPAQSESNGQPSLSAVGRMQAAAADAVDLARRRFGVDLDYSEASAARVEQILDHISSQPGVTDEELWALALAFGGYLGEVFRRRWGGEWQDQDPSTGGLFPLVIGGITLFPAHKVHKRLFGGEEENVSMFYQTVKTHLGGRARSE